MAIHFTIEEKACLLSLYRQFQHPSYDDACRRDEAWLANHRHFLTAAIKKLNSPEALVPTVVEDLVVIEEAKPKPPPPPAPKAPPPSKKKLDVESKPEPKAESTAKKLDEDAPKSKPKD